MIPLLDMLRDADYNRLHRIFLQSRMLSLLFTGRLCLLRLLRVFDFENEILVVLFVAAYAIIQPFTFRIQAVMVTCYQIASPFLRTPHDQLPASGSLDTCGGTIALRRLRVQVGLGVYDVYVLGALVIEL